MSITPLSQLGADTPRRYTVDDIMALRPCPGWGRARVTAAFGSRTRVTATEIATAEDVSQPDRLYVLISLMDASTQCLFACDCAERVAHLAADPRSTAAVTVTRRFVFGLASDDDLDAARHGAMGAMAAMADSTSGNAMALGAMAAAAWAAWAAWSTLNNHWAGAWQAAMAARRAVGRAAWAADADWGWQLTRAAQWLVQGDRLLADVRSAVSDSAAAV